MLPNKSIEVKWASGNRKHYESKGYIFTKRGDLLEVDIEDLPKTSRVEMLYICDYCNECKSKPYILILQGRKIIKKDCCSNQECMNKKLEEVTMTTYGVKNRFQNEEVKDKIKETNLEKYGYESPMQNSDIRLKAKATNLKRYGTESPMQSEIVLQKVKDTNLKKYGVDNPFKSEEVKEKIKEVNIEKYGVDYYTQTIEYRRRFKETCLEKYGEEHFMHTDEIKDKIKETNLNRYGAEYYLQTEEGKSKMKSTMLERYGAEHASQVPEIREKISQSYYINGTTPTSSQQYYIYEKLLELEYDVKLNYPLSRVNLDIALFYGELKIDIEYDGSHWHTDSNSDRKRDEFLKSKGWKVLRIKSRRKTPTTEELVHSINKLIYSDKKYTQLNLSDYEDVKIS